MTLYFILPWGDTTALTESVIFHPVGQIQTRKSSWIVSSAIDFGPYNTAVTNLKIYGRNILASIDQFQRTINFDKAHEHLIRLTLYDVNSSITAINEAHNKFSDLTGMIHNETVDIRDHCYHWVDYSVFFLALLIKKILLKLKGM